jgi:hypothetical protein
MKLKKTLIRSYAKELREELRSLEEALKNNDLEWALNDSNNIVACAAEISGLVEYAAGGAPYGWEEDDTPTPPIPY